jgi:hypothetical protein
MGLWAPAAREAARMSKKTRIVFSTYCTVKFAALNVLAPEIAGNYIAPETDCKAK